MAEPPAAWLPLAVGALVWSPTPACDFDVLHSAPAATPPYMSSWPSPGPLFDSGGSGCSAPAVKREAEEEWG